MGEPTTAIETQNEGNFLALRTEEDKFYKELESFKSKEAVEPGTAATAENKSEDKKTPTKKKYSEEEWKEIKEKRKLRKKFKAAEKNSQNFKNSQSFQKPAPKRPDLATRRQNQQSAAARRYNQNSYLNLNLWENMNRSILGQPFVGAMQQGPGFFPMAVGNNMVDTPSPAMLLQQQQQQQQAQTAASGQGAMLQMTLNSILAKLETVQRSQVEAMKVEEKRMAMEKEHLDVQRERLEIEKERFFLTEKLANMRSEEVRNIQTAFETETKDLLFTIEKKLESNRKELCYFIENKLEALTAATNRSVAIVPSRKPDDSDNAVLSPLSLPQFVRSASTSAPWQEEEDEDMAVKQEDVGYSRRYEAAPWNEESGGKQQEGSSRSHHTSAPWMDQQSNDPSFDDGYDRRGARFATRWSDKEDSVASSSSAGGGRRNGKDNSSGGGFNRQKPWM